MALIYNFGRLRTAGPSSSLSASDLPVCGLLEELNYILGSCAFFVDVASLTSGRIPTKGGADKSETIVAQATN